MKLRKVKNTCLPIVPSVRLSSYKCRIQNFAINAINFAINAINFAINAINFAINAINFANAKTQTMHTDD